MSLHQRRNYIDAVLCLQRVKSISGIQYAKNRFDDFQAVHFNQTDYIHFVGHFIVWHRYFLGLYEKTLREECGYKGGQPYWDYTLDAEPQNLDSMSIYSTEIFDPATGFGGNGNKVVPTPEQNPLNINGTGGGCVQDGPFVPKNLMLNFPGPEPQCLRRDFSPSLLNRGADPKVLNNILAQPDFVTFDRTLQGVKNLENANIHAGGHFGIGGALGQAGDVYNSPAEPLFYLHHGALDWIYWRWQQKDLPTRLHQVGGNLIPEDYTNKTAVTLDFQVNIGKLAGDLRLEQLLDTQGEILCYTY
jgi:tyrosinase